MVRKKVKESKEDNQEQNGSGGDFTADLIKLLNKERKERVAYNLATDLSPTHIKRWISTGCKSLDYIISNRNPGGLPEGRIIEIFGPPSIGKSHIAIQIARSSQKLGGIVVYIDTENATDIENLRSLGVDISNRFVFCEASSIEDVFQIADRTIQKTRELNKDIPVTIIWDSVAGTPALAELKGDYDDAQIGVAARAISKGMRKITQTIGNQNILFVALNQTRTGIGIMFGDPTVVPGGKSIPYHASVRIRLGAGQPIKDNDGKTIGINVSAKTIKNKVSYPFRECDFEIHFGKGVFEHEQLFDSLRQYCDKHGKVRIDDKHDVLISGSGAWKQFQLWKSGVEEPILERKFHKSKFDEVINDEETKEFVKALLDKAFIIDRQNEGDVSLDGDSYIDANAAMDSLIEETYTDLVGTQ